MIRLCTGLFLWLALSLSAAAGVVPENGHDEAVYYADAYAAHYEIPKELVHAIITQESGWNPSAVSAKGAMGLMQLMPATRRSTACATLLILQKISPAGFDILPT